MSYKNEFRCVTGIFNSGNIFFLEKQLFFIQCFLRVFFYATSISNIFIIFYFLGEILKSALHLLVKWEVDIGNFNMELN